MQGCQATIKGPPASNPGLPSSGMVGGHCARRNDVGYAQQLLPAGIAGPHFPGTPHATKPPFAVAPCLALCGSVSAIFHILPCVFT